MNEPKSSEPLAKVVLLRYENKDNDIIDVDGHEDEVIQLLALAFVEFPELLKYFAIAQRYYRRYYIRRNN